MHFYVCLLLLLTIGLQSQLSTAFIGSTGLLKHTKWLRVLSATTDGSPSELDATVVYVGNLPWSVMEPELINLAKEKGATGKAVARVAKNDNTGKSRGFGYLQYSNKNDAMDAIAKLTGAAIEGRVLKVDLDYGKDKRTIVDRSVQWNNGANPEIIVHNK